MQDEALYKCRLLLFEDLALEAQPWCVVPKGYLSSGGIFGGVSSQPLMGKHVGKVARSAGTPPEMGLGDNLLTIRVLEHRWGPT